jgi:predicted nucleic acid-binding protein
MIVLDASAAVEYVLGTTPGLVVREWILSDVQVHYPELMSVEVASALRRLVRRGDLTPRRAAAAIEDILDLDGTPHRHDLFLLQAFTYRDRFSVYDAMYVALARALDARLMTADARLARAAESLVAVELVS